MLQSEETESGYLESGESESYVGSTMRDVEILHVSTTNVLARGRRYGRMWFLKGLREEFRESAGMRRRLIKEFELQSRLRHPAIVPAVGLEEIEGLGLCIVQEWVEGITLREALMKGDLTSGKERRRLLHELTEVVAYLHGSGVVHRDLKPSNVMIRNIGREIVLIDFGLADSGDYVEMKQPAGTAGYISPRQVESGGADPGDDVYSLGVMMREVYPRYRRLADRCTGNLSRRPKDAGELLKLMERRSALMKTIGIASVSIALICMGVFAVKRMAALEQAASVSQQHIAALNEKNTENMKQVATLIDSLTGVRGKLDNAETQLADMREYEELKRNKTAEGKKMVERLFSKYDRDFVSKLDPEDGERFNTSQPEFLHAVNSSIEEYCKSLPATLNAEDRTQIQAALSTHFGNCQMEFNRKWIKKFFS